jgi:hypothetical protein
MNEDEEEDFQMMSDEEELLMSERKFEEEYKDFKSGKREELMKEEMSFLYFSHTTEELVNHDRGIKLKEIFTDEE